MFRHVGNRVSFKKLKAFAERSSFRHTHFLERQSKLNPYHNCSYNQRSFHISVLSDLKFKNLIISLGLSSHRFVQGFASSAAVVEQIVSIEEEEEDSDEVSETEPLLDTDKNSFNVRNELKNVGRIGQGKYTALRRRLIKIETEAWEAAAREYQELLVDMCAQKLSANLLSVKSLFLGWFEPLKNAVSAEQDLCKEGKNRGVYAPQFD